jgi:hypothetical protein
LQALGKVDTSIILHSLIAKLILSILQALGKVDTSIILHSLIAKLHCIAIWRKMKEVENG